MENSKNAMSLMKSFLVLIIIFLCQKPFAQDTIRHWAVVNSNKTFFDVAKDGNHPYQDNIEMSGRRVSGIISYSIDSNRVLSLSREIFFPQLRTFLKSNEPKWKFYRAYLKDIYHDDILPQLVIKGMVYTPGPLEKVMLNGTLEFYHEAVNGIRLKRILYPSMKKRIFLEQWTITNTGDSTATLFGGENYCKKVTLGTKGDYTTVVSSNLPDKITLPKGASATFTISISAQLNEEEEIVVHGDEFYSERLDFLHTVKNSLNLVTPNETLNTLFEFSKIRASESIFESKLGLVHSPGGGRYYAGFWANDEAEYVGPFFPYLGYKTGNDASLNVYRLFAKETNDAYRNIPYSFEMEGDAPRSTLDRGDAAMIAYGTAQFALARGDKNIAEELWPLVQWCLEYNHIKLNSSRVVTSESDEMEGRIPTGTANLSTSSLYYGALGLAVSLGASLHKPQNELNSYAKQSVKLKKAIEEYFGAHIEGLDTYKYYKEHTKLRHWICLPLVVGIYDRKEGTIKALFDKLWSENGVHVEKNEENKAISKIFWDRGTLYALRGTFLAGATEESMKKLIQFSNKRLLGNRVPYVVEAYPEGNMAHLSAESGLYCRVFTEGIFGIVPTGLHSFITTPRLPKEWNYMALDHMKAFGQDFDIDIKRDGKKLLFKVINADGTLVLKKKINDGDSIKVIFK